MPPNARIRLLFSLSAALPFSESSGHPVFSWRASVSCGHLLGLLFRALRGGWRRSRKEKELPLCRWRVQQVRMVGMVKALPSRPALPLLRANSHQLRERLKVSQQILLLVSCLKQIFVTIITVIVANGKCFGCRSEVSPARSEA